MAVVIPPGYGIMYPIWTLTGDPEPMTTSLGYSFDTEVSDALTRAEAFAAEWADWQSQWSDDYTFYGLSTRENNGTVLTDSDVITPTVSVADAAVLPQNVAILIRKRTGVAGPKNRGRMFLPPGRLAEVDVSNTGIIDSADVAVIQAELDALFDALLDAPGVFGWQLLHTDELDTPTAITQLQLDPKVATQRRRLRR